MSVLRVEALCKEYVDYGSEWRRILSWTGWPVTPRARHRVLENVGFTLEAGEAVGIVGQNGAGKSTLLKIITGTMEPSSGRVSRQGRIAAILELGMGFHPEFTGRRNVYLAAGLLGFSREEIDAKMEEIEAFAEIGEYFDQPVRTYSSGMQMRLAFSIATAWRPDLLIVDEALSVGDLYFQHKSFDRIRAYREAGSALLLVSHDRTAIQAVCDRAILLEKGQVLKDGDPEAVMDFYNALIAKKEGSHIRQTLLANGRTRTVSGTGEAAVSRIALYDEEGRECEAVGVGERVRLEIEVEVRKDLDSLVLGYGIRDRLGQVIFGTNTWYLGEVLEAPKAGSRYRYTLEFPANFGPGSYSIQTALVDRENHLGHNYEWIDLAKVFEVVNIDKEPFDGLCWCRPQIKVESVE